MILDREQAQSRMKKAAVFARRTEAGWLKALGANLPVTLRLQAAECRSSGAHGSAVRLEAWAWINNRACAGTDCGGASARYRVTRL